MDLEQQMFLPDSAWILQHICFHLQLYPAEHMYHKIARSR